MAKDIVYSAELDRTDLRKMSKDIGKVGDLQGIDSKTLRKRWSQPLGKIKGDLGEFQKSMEASNARVIAFGASTALIAGVATALKGAAKAAIDVERSLADINVILNATSKGLQNFGQELFAIARNTGQSFQVVADAAGELARQGLGVEDTLRRTRDALILARLAGMDTVDAVNSLTAAVNSFSKSALTSTEIVNKLANVDAAFAVSSADLAEAIKRVGSSASDAGVSMDQLIAIVTTAQQTTARGGAVIGNSFKTIFTRLQRPAVLDQLEALGIATKDASGNIMPLMGVLKGLAGSFDKLEDVQKSQIAELVGGVFQVNVLKAALSDLGQEYSVYGRALDTSISSTNEAIERNERLNETLSSLINRTFVNLQNVGAQVGDIGFAPRAKGILEFLNKGLESDLASNVKTGETIGNQLTKGIIKGLGNFFLGGPGMMLGALGIFKLFGNLKTFALDAFKGITGLNAGTKKRAAMQEQITQLLMQDDKLLDQIAAGNMDVAKAADAVMKKYQDQEAILGRISRLSKGAAGRIPTGTGGGKASGFIPNFSGKADERLAMLAAGYNPSDIRNASIRKTKIHNGRGGSFSSYTNSKETVRTGTNAQGYKATFVVPPKSSSAYGNYVSNIPNFASGSQMEDMLRRAGSKGGLGSFVFSGSGNPTNRLFKEISDSAGGFTARQKKEVVKTWARSKGGRESIRQNAADRTGRKGDQASRLAGALGGRKGNPLLVFSGEKGSIKGELIGGGAAYEVGIPINKTLLNQGLMQAYPNYVGNAISHPNMFDKDLSKGFVASLKNRVKTSAPDKEGLGQIYGAVLQTVTSGFGSSAQFGSKRYDFKKGGKLDDRLAKFYNKKDPRVGKLFPHGAELKGGEYDLGNIFGKMAAEDKLSKADLIGVGGTKKRYAKAGGFFPNFSAKKRAMATERAMGGTPEFREFPFPHVADKNKQKSFKDVLRDHPEGIGKAISNSYSAQGIPNFANPFSGPGSFFDELKASMFGGMSKGESAELGDEYAKLSRDIETLDQTLELNTKELKKHKGEIEKANRGEKSTLTGKKTPMRKDGVTWKKSSKEYKAAVKEEARLERAIDPTVHKRSKDLPRAKQKVIQEKTEAVAAKQAKGDKMRSKAFSAAFLLPTVAGPITEMIATTEAGKKGMDQFTTGLSTAATALTMIPGPAGAIVAAGITLASGFGALTNVLANVGEGIGENKEVLRDSLQKLQDSSSKYFEVSSQLDNAIKSGASGDTLTRLGNKLEDTLSKLEPAQQAVLTSAMSLADKQAEMAKIIDEKAQTLKQVEIAEGLASNINDARGMGVASFFKGIFGRKGFMRGGSFKEGANDVDAITSKNVRSFGAGIFSSVGAKDMRKIAAGGGLSKGNFVGSLESAGVDHDLIAMLNELNEEGLENLRQGIVRTTKEAERNAKVAAANVKVQKMYNQLIADSTRATQEASDHLLHIQKRLVENFVFNREMQSDKVFNQIDIHIAKFDALFGAAAQNLNAFEKADINFRKKKLSSEIDFQKKVTANQNTFIQSASEIASVSTGVTQEKTDKKQALRRSQKQVDQSLIFTDALKRFDALQDIENFNSSIKDLLIQQGGSTQKAQDKLETEFAKFNQTNAKQLEEQKKAYNIALEIREIEKRQAELQRGGGIKALLDPNSFVQMNAKLVDAMENMFAGQGWDGGAFGANNEQAGTGFLNVLKMLRDQGFDTRKFARNNPNLTKRAIDAKQAQNSAMAGDMRWYANAMGDPALAQMANQVSDPRLAKRQVRDFLDPGREARRQQDLQRKLISDQGDVFKTGIDRIEQLTKDNVEKQGETFIKLDNAAQDLEEASAALFRIETMRQFDTTAARMRKEASQQKIKDAASSGSAAAKSAAAEFGDFADLLSAGGGMQDVFKNAQGMEQNQLHGILAGFGLKSKQNFWQTPNESAYSTIMSDIVGDRRFMEAFGETSAKTGMTVSKLGKGGADKGWVSVLLSELQERGMATGLSPAEEGQLVKSMHQMMFDHESASGNWGNMVETLQTMNRKGQAPAKNLLDALIDNTAAANELNFSTKDLANKQRDGKRALEDLNSNDKLFGRVTQDDIDRTLDRVSTTRVREGDAPSKDKAFDVDVDVFTDKVKKATAPFVKALKDPLMVNFGEHIVKVSAAQALQQGIVDQITATTAEKFVQALEASGMTTDIEMLKRQMGFLKDASNIKTQGQMNLANLPLVRANKSGRVIPTRRTN